MDSNSIYFWGLDIGFAVAVLLYILRVVTKGRPKYERVELQGNSRFLNKYVMEMGYWVVQPFAAFLVRLRITANQISWASLFFGLGAGVLIATGSFFSAAVLGLLAAVLDMLDGMVARLTSTASRAGEVLDSAMDRNVEFFFIGGVLIFYRFELIILILGLFTLFGSFMVSYTSMMARAENVKLLRSKWSMRRPERIVYLLLGAMLYRVSPYSMPIALAIVAVFANYSAIDQASQIIAKIRETPS